MAKDDWKKAALNDSALVAELLLTMKHSQQSSFKPTVNFLPPRPISVLSRWGAKRLRSTPVYSCDGGMVRKNVERIRISPSTPLSWSGGSGSPSSIGGGADGCETSSSHRSKGALTITFDSASNLKRRPRKKMTFAKLKEEEKKLLNERICLNKNLEALRATLEEQTARNLQLKRLKMEHIQQHHTMKKIAASYRVEKSEATHQRYFLDLNTTPSEAEFDSCT